MRNNVLYYSDTTLAIVSDHYGNSLFLGGGLSGSRNIAAFIMGLKNHPE